MLAIEVDGNSHESKFLYDQMRQLELEEQGVRFLRVTDAEVKKEMFSVLLKIEQTIDELKNC